MNPPATSRKFPWAALASWGITLLSVAFLGWAAYRVVERSAGFTWNPVHAVWMGPVALVYSVVFVGLAALFWLNVRTVSGLTPPARPVMKVFLVTNLGRYLPGNVFHLVGRHVQLRRLYGVPHGDLGLIQVLDLGLILVANIVLWAGIQVFQPRPEGWALALRYGVDPASPWFWLVLIFGLLTAVIGLVWGRRFSVVRRLLAAQTLLAFTGIFLATLALYLVYGLLFLFLCQTLFPIGGISGAVFSSFVLAFLLGFILPGAPGGLGVREAVLVFALGPVVGEAAALEAALLFRGATLIGDALAAGAGWLLGPKKQIIGSGEHD